MADIERLIPHILRWECGVLKKEGQTNREYFQIARKKGWSDKKSDRGGKTMCGVTLKTFTEYRKKKGLPAPTAQELRDIDYDTWLDVLRTLFWNRWKADQIQNQSMQEPFRECGERRWSEREPEGMAQQVEQSQILQRMSDKDYYEQIFEQGFTRLLRTSIAVLLGVVACVLISS